MRRHLPPLNALRAFEAAARHLSFTRAAEELAVTQAAISHQVKALEEWLGVDLFIRRNRKLFLTEAGQAYLPPLTNAFNELDDATHRTTRVDSSGVLTVSVLPSFAAKWLVPRIGKFRERHPDIDILISPSEDLVQFDRDGVDVGVRHGSGGWPGLHSERFLPEAPFSFNACSRPFRETHFKPRLSMVFCCSHACRFREVPLSYLMILW